MIVRKNEYKNDLELEAPESTGRAWSRAVGQSLCMMVRCRETRPGAAATAYGR